MPFFARSFIIEISTLSCLIIKLLLTITPFLAEILKFNNRNALEMFNWVVFKESGYAV